MNIISRSEWGARAPRGRDFTTWAARREFVVHHSEGPITQSVRSIQDFHMDGNGWADIGYNFLVDHKGRAYAGRGWLVIGAHAVEHNTSGIGVCVIGRDGADITPAARAAVRQLYDAANAKAGRVLAKRCHSDLNETDCPGDVLRAWVRAGMPRDGGGSPSTPVPDWQETMMRRLPTLATGAAGEHVETVQGLLRARSHPVELDGRYGPATAAAVRAVQRWGGVQDDGIVGPATWPVLLRVN
ncbi:peptidoglycan recognition protein family protein [Actinomadura geliboluensis]|uniref:peptidoglycan recognition protein family protein n=1 Tax=Actinomadura geliboluensis TaxID=882440 RepID=UPI002604AD64|nr:peptidoglycan-binding domain-containing protein [Actinomadura geliboluensis]